MNASSDAGGDLYREPIDDQREAEHDPI